MHLPVKFLNKPKCMVAKLNCDQIPEQDLKATIKTDYIDIKSPKLKMGRRNRC